MGGNPLTAKEWWAKGYRIIKGERHRKRNKQGVCVFYENQVRQRGYWLEYEEDDDDEWDDPWPEW